MFDPADLIGPIIDAVADDEAFADLPRAMAQVTQCASTQFQTHASTGAETQAVFGIEPALVEQYNAHYWRHDVWAAAYARSPWTIAKASRNFIRDDDMFNTEIYQDLMRPNGDFFRCVGFIAPLGSSVNFLFGAHRVRRQSDFDDDFERAIQALQPHLTRLMSARRRAKTVGGALAKALVEDADDAILIVTPTAHVLYANAAARAFGQAGGVLALRLGRLSSDDGEIDPALQGAVRRACAGRGGAVLELDRMAGGVFLLAVDPFRAGDRPLACVRVRDQAAHLQRVIGQARATFALTAAETRLAEALARGVSPATYAAGRGVAISTVRSQIRSLLAKTGSSGQLDMIRRLTRSL